jgi:hypothetical protein
VGYGVWAPQLPMVAFNDLYALPPFTGDETRTALAQDWYLTGLSPRDPIEIPYSWLSGSFRTRIDKAITYAAVTKAGAGTAIASTPAAQQVKFEATLESANDVDAPNLAHFMTVYYDQPKTRIASMRMILNERTPEEIATILGAGIGSHFHIVGHPARWPAEASHQQVIEGIGHESSGDLRIVVWSTSPHVGEDVEEAGPFFRVGVSQLDGPDKLPW